MSAVPQVWLVGGATDCDVVVRRPEVAARHCLLIAVDDVWFVDDLGSSSGTFVGGRRVTRRTVWNPRETLTLASGVRIERPERPPAVTRVALTIGSDRRNDLVLDHPSVAPKHALFRATYTESYLEDLGSAEGTFLNGKGIGGGRGLVRATDVVRFGRGEVSAAELFQEISLHRRPYVVVRRGGKSTLLLGSAANCDRVFPKAGIAPEHARLTRAAGGFTVEDLQSPGGTFVDGVRIRRRTPVRDGDEIALGRYAFRLASLAEDYAPQTGRVTLAAAQIGVDVPGKRLLNDVSLTLLPGELTGLMGLSGAGKSTFINALNGYVRPTSGRVLVNGVDLYEHFELFQERIGYVPQDDIVHDDLTVGLALYYSARLRLPPSTSDDEVRARVDTTLKELGLLAARDVLIGSPTKKGISGGQRKRVNLAMELITDPPLLFLDEPTSGLSSPDALNVILLLRRLADRGKTILITVHQPAPDAFQLLDQVAVVAADAGDPAGGRLAYFGPAYPDSLDFFHQATGPERAPPPDDLLRGLARAGAADWEARYRRSPYYRTFVAARAAETEAAPLVAAPRKPTLRKRVHDCRTLIRRALSVKVRDRWNSTVLMLQAPVIGVLIALVFGRRSSLEMTPEDWHDGMRATASVVFLLMLSAIWFGCSGAAREIVGEWAIYRRERMVNLGIVPYVLSKFVTLSLFCVGQCAVLLAIGYAACGLRTPWTIAFPLLLLGAVSGIGLGLIVSSFARSSEMAIACLPLVILPMVVLCGVLQPLKDMNVVARSTAQWMPSRWGFEALLLAESERRPLWTPPLPPVVASPPRTPQGLRDANPQELVTTAERRDVAEYYFPSRTYRMGTAACTGVLAGLAAVFAVAVGVILYARDTR